MISLISYMLEMQFKHKLLNQCCTINLELIYYKLYIFYKLNNIFELPFFFDTDLVSDLAPPPAFVLLFSSILCPLHIDRET